MKLPHRYRWSWLLAAIAVIAVLAFAACEEDEDGGKTPGPGESPAAGERIPGAAPPEVSEDGKTYTITLREGLLWSDGDPLLAEDFVLGIHRTCNPVNAGEYQYVLTNVVGCDDHYGADAFDQALEDAIGVKAIDDLTIEFP